MSGLFDLRGRVALVTGATGGMGAAIVEALADQGASVVLSDRDPERCTAAVQQLRARGVEAQASPCDMADPGAARALAVAAAAHYGRIDILVCNAGVQGPAGPIGQITDADWDAVMGINLRSALALSNAVIPDMAARGSGSVVLMASIASVRGNKSIGLYGLSKAGLTQLARNLAVEWGPQGVRVNAISPGLIHTPLAEGLLGNPEFMARRLSLTPLRRVGLPQEVAAVAVLLASPGGAFITGQNVIVDGGTTISDGN